MHMAERTVGFSPCDTADMLYLYEGGGFWWCPCFPMEMMSVNGKGSSNLPSSQMSVSHRYPRENKAGQGGSMQPFLESEYDFVGKFNHHHVLDVQMDLDFFHLGLFVRPSWKLRLVLGFAWKERPWSLLPRSILATKKRFFHSCLSWYVVFPFEEVASGPHHPPS